jgi:hypothetical protein
MPHAHTVNAKTAAVPLRLGVQPNRLFRTVFSFLPHELPERWENSECAIVDTNGMGQSIL